MTDVVEAATPAAGRSLIDGVVFAFVTSGWDANKIAHYEATVREQNHALSPEVSHTFASIDAKATGLLTYVSMMIVGLGLIAPLVADNDNEVGVVVAEIGVYLLIALGCLRCLSVFRTYEFVGAGAEVTSIIHRELIIRRELYSTCIRAAIGFTIVVLLLLPVLYFWTPGKS
jgi:hypothetical protein